MSDQQYLNEEDRKFVENHIRQGYPKLAEEAAEALKAKKQAEMMAQYEAEAARIPRGSAHIIERANLKLRWRARGLEVW